MKFFRLGGITGRIYFVHSLPSEHSVTDNIEAAFLLVHCNKTNNGRTIGYLSRMTNPGGNCPPFFKLGSLSPLGLDIHGSSQGIF